MILAELAGLASFLHTVDDVICSCRCMREIIYGATYGAWRACN